MRDLTELEITGMPGSLLDRFADFRLRCFTETGQFRHAARLARLAQLLD
jgi:hypothetical protein